MRKDKCRRDRFKVLRSALMPAGEHTMPCNGSLQLKELFVHTKRGKMFLSEEAFSVYTEGLQTDVKKYIFVSVLCFPCNHVPNRKVRDSWSCPQRTNHNRSIHLNIYLFKMPRSQYSGVVSFRILTAEQAGSCFTDRKQRWHMTRPQQPKPLMSKSWQETETSTPPLSSTKY